MEKNEGKEPTKWERYAKGKKPSMKRRCSLNDYLDVGIYMITIAIEGRKPLLGRLAGDTPEEAHVELSAFGERTKACWMAIPRYYPQIEVVKVCIMPDHIHGILYVHERIKKHLGHVIWGFKAGCRKAARELGILPAVTAEIPQFTGQTQQNTAHSVKYTAVSPQFTGQTQQNTAHSVKYTAVSPQSIAQPTPQPPPQPSPKPSSYDRHHGLIWEENYNDRILRGRGQYERMKAYLDDNPRRLLIKRLHPEYFTHLGTITAAGIPMQAMGNRFLLDNPVKIQIQCSRRMTAKEIEHYKETILAKAQKEGAIVVSPCISPGEQQTATAAMATGLPLIVLLLNGLPPLFKPQPRYLQACEEGRLLILAPFAYQNERLEHMRQRCLQLNAFVAEICKED